VETEPGIQAFDDAQGEHKLQAWAADGKPNRNQLNPAPHIFLRNDVSLDKHWLAWSGSEVDNITRIL
jgi:hypothetical protein